MRSVEFKGSAQYLQRFIHSKMIMALRGHLCVEDFLLLKTYLSLYSMREVMS